MSLRIVVIFLLSGLPCYAQAQTALPRVSPAVQKERDIDRRQILEAELQTLTGELSKVQAAGAVDQSVERDADLARRRENIRSLKRELAGMDGAARPAHDSSRAMVKATRRSLADGEQLGLDNQPRYWDPYSRATHTPNQPGTLKGSQ